MSKLRVNAFAISIDGYGAGPDQSLDNPMGVGGMALHKWVLGTNEVIRRHAIYPWGHRHTAECDIARM